MRDWQKRTLSPIERMALSHFCADVGCLPEDISDIKVTESWDEPPKINITFEKPVTIVTAPVEFSV